MSKFTFIHLDHCPREDSVVYSDLYFEANLIDSPRDYFERLTLDEQNEILSFYRSGKFLKVLYENELFGFVGHGSKANSDSILISYILLPSFRGKGLFQPLIHALAEWCREKYPEKTHLRANTEATNMRSIASLKKAGFEFLEEKLDGPSGKKVLFHCFQRKL